MEDLLTKVGPFLMQASYILMAIVVIASIVAKITPTPKDNKAVSTAASYILRLIKFLPTVGVNPATKELERAYEELKEKKDETSKPA